MGGEGKAGEVFADCGVQILVREIVREVNVI
jgi:hypothetical protein